MGEFVMPGYLNEYQRKAVLDKSSACLVNANVGSGKTTVLTVKIRYLHESADISYRDMVVLTFTNKAANEIKERLAASEEAPICLICGISAPFTAWRCSFCGRSCLWGSWAILLISR